VKSASKLLDIHSSVQPQQSYTQSQICPRARFFIPYARPHFSAYLDQIWHPYTSRMVMGMESDF